MLTMLGILSSPCAFGIRRRSHQNVVISRIVTNNVWPSFHRLKEEGHGLKTTVRTATAVHHNSRHGHILVDIPVKPQETKARRKDISVCVVGILTTLLLAPDMPGATHQKL